MSAEVQHNNKSNTFPLFPNLPIEIQRFIWVYAALDSQSQPELIHFSLSDRESQSNCSSWKHLFPSSRHQSHPLLLACTESRNAILTSASHVFGMEVAVKFWFESGESRSHYPPCSFELEMKRFGKRIYWKPEIDAVFLQYERESRDCHPTSICNVNLVSEFEFVFDERVRYVGASLAVWARNIQVLVFQPEIIFVVVEKDKVYREPWRLENHDFVKWGNKMEWGDICKEVLKEWKRNGRAYSFSSFEHFYDHSPVLMIVDSEEMMIEELRSR